MVTTVQSSTVVVVVVAVVAVAAEATAAAVAVAVVVVVVVGGGGGLKLSILPPFAYCLMQSVGLLLFWRSTFLWLVKKFLFFLFAEPRRFIVVFKRVRYWTLS
jgi:hypothetical protein